MQMICICNDTAKGNFCQVPKPKENSEKKRLHCRNGQRGTRHGDSLAKTALFQPIPPGKVCVFP